MTVSYFLIGAATVGSYFAALTCGESGPSETSYAGCTAAPFLVPHPKPPLLIRLASLSFPSHPTISLSIPLSLISLSSLVLSSFSSLRMFQSPIGELDPVRYMTFLGLLSLSLNIFSSLFMRILPQRIALPISSDEVDDEDEEEGLRSPTSQLLHLDEHTPLIIGGPEAAREDAVAIVRGKERWTVSRLLVDWGGFWSFGILLALCIGPVSEAASSIASVYLTTRHCATVILY